VPRFIADLHVHSHFSIATSRQANVVDYARSAARKGLHLVGTGDCIHPGYLEELQTYLVENNTSGFYQLKEEYRKEWASELPPSCTRNPIHFILSTEISTIYKKNGKVRKLHHLLLFPTLASAQRYSRYWDQRGNIRSDGRPILGCDSYDLLHSALEIDDSIIFIPAHIWTPHFSLYGSFSGFNSIQECFGELSSHIYAVETGLSSDPPMNWRIKELENYFLVSNSDAHSPGNLAREANIFNTDFSYKGILQALKNRSPSAELEQTLEFFPQEGKYHFDGHRKCNLFLDPEEACRLNNICPVCQKRLTPGVLHRVLELADKPPDIPGSRGRPYHHLISLTNLLAECWNMGVTSRKVLDSYRNLIRLNGPELDILLNLSPDELKMDNPLLKEALHRMRLGQIDIRPGYDGEYGQIQVFNKSERSSLFKTGFHSIGKAYSIIQTLEKKKRKYIVSEQIAMDMPELHPLPLQGIRDLNSQQLELVHSPPARIFVQAGPGTGKTTVLIDRIKELHLSADWSEILVVTFTQKAAQEILNRLKLFKRPPWVGTFHSIAWDLINLSHTQPLQIINEKDRQLIINQLIQMNNSSLKPTHLLKRFDEAVNGFPKPANMLLTEDEFLYYQKYRRYLEHQQLVDYNELLLRTLQWQPTAERPFPRHILVDELQDCNPIQYEWLKHFGQQAETFFLIGDYYQSIYEFRGASPQELLHIESHFTGIETVQLRQSYRLPVQLLKAAPYAIRTHPLPIQMEYGEKPRFGIFQIIEHPSSAYEKSFWRLKTIELLGGKDMNIGSSGAGSYAPSDIAFLFRAHRVLRDYCRYFTEQGIPITVHQDEWDASAITFLKLLRSLNHPESGFYRSMAPEIEPVLFNKFVKQIQTGFSRQLLTSIQHHLQMEDLEEVHTLGDILLESQNWPATLEQILNGQPLHPNSQNVHLMTIHSAKGLEFPVVILPALQEGYLPAPEYMQKGTEEEERLFYVAMTRAKNELYLSYHAPNPSLFLSRVLPFAQFKRNYPDHEKPFQLGLF